MNKQIVSKFYLITVENTPIYVGFTNRDIATRFREHKHDKELPENAKIQEIDRLVYDFSWDVTTVNNNAKEVSDREAELIEKYGTQDSEYQKAIGGGQVWNEIKHFTIINREDPFWQSMPEDIILETIETLKAKKVRLEGTIRQTKITSRLESVIWSTKTTARMESVIQHTKTTQRLESVIWSTKTTVRMENVINGTNNGRRLKSVIDNTKTCQRLENVVRHTRGNTRINNIINHTRNTIRLGNVINNTKVQ